MARVQTPYIELVMYASELYARSRLALYPSVSPLAYFYLKVKYEYVNLSSSLQFIHICMYVCKCFELRYVHMLTIITYILIILTPNE